MRAYSLSSRLPQRHCESPFCVLSILLPLILLCGLSSASSQVNVCFYLVLCKTDTNTRSPYCLSSLLTPCLQTHMRSLFLYDHSSEVESGHRSFQVVCPPSFTTMKGSEMTKLAAVLPNWVRLF